jgi:hypothetical protein
LGKFEGSWQLKQLNLASRLKKKDQHNLCDSELDRMVAGSDRFDFDFVLGALLARFQFPALDQPSRSTQMP